MKLITALPDVVKSPNFTADWENALTLVTREEEFISIMLDGFSQEEIDSMKKQNDRILRNINTYLKGKETE